MDEYQAIFLEEAQELLIDLEDSLLALERSPHDKELISRIFRAMHTIKGSGAMFGFDDVAAFTHEIETFYDKVREEKIPVTPELINLTLIAKDQIRALLTTPPGEAPPSLTDTIASFHSLASGGERNTPPKNTSPSEGASPPPHNNDGEPVVYRIRFKPDSQIFLTGTNPINLLNELRLMGKCEVVAHTEDIPLLDDINPEACYTSWDIILTTSQEINTIKDVFIFIEEDSEIKIDVISGEAGDKKVGEILLERGDITHKALDEVLNDKKFIGEILVEKGLVSSSAVESALVEQNTMRETAGKQEEAASSIRVPAERLDVLVNLVGELVTVQARLTQTASTANGAELTAIAEEVERLTGELRDTTLNIRMLPIGTTFGRFKRLVRDLSRDLGKEIELTTEGADTELDKTVIEKINDPLVHLIRNSIDHGIESPEERASIGKPRAGTINLSAAHSGANVLIQIQDDGKGLDKEAILAKAIERGLVSPSVELTDKELFSFIFHPGFSTAKVVTNVSGRGVGMDVVRRAIDALRGTIDVQSEKGRGTTVSVTLPLTLAIVEGLLVAIKDNYFVLPLSIVEECVELTREDVREAHGKNVAYIRGEMVPYISLRKAFSISGEPPAIEQIVITGNNNGKRVGFVVDNVIGEHQTVIKNLGRLYRDVEGVSGATILGDGTVALIVDIPKLVQGAEKEQHA